VRLYDRRWRVQVGELVSESIDIRFKAKRTSAPRPGTLELEVFNFSAAHRGEVLAARRGTLVELRAGYADACPVVFRGDLRRATEKRDGTSWITTVTAGDGEYAIRTARASRSFAAETALADVFRALADAMGVGEGNAGEATAGAQLGTVGALFPAGTTLHGLAADELTRLCRGAGLTWSIQEGALQLLPVGTALQRTAVLLASSTGLVGSPEVGQGRSVKARALLIPDLVPGRLVELQSATASGTYRIHSTELSGETRGTDWYVAMNLRRDA